MTVHWIVLDGAAAWVVDELVARGELPALAGLRAAGSPVALEPPAPNCQTPPGLATLFTGATPAEHGITGFFLPGGPDGDPAGWRRAFTPGAPRRPMVWERAGRAGLRTSSLHAPWVFDADGKVAETVDVAVEAYSTRIARERAQRLDGNAVLWNDLGDPVELRARDAGTFTVHAAGCAELVVGADWVPHVLPSGVGSWYRAVDTPDGLVAARTGSWRPRVAGHDPDLVAAVSAACARRPFVGDSTGSLYRAGTYGPTLADGGDGRAEEVLLSGAALLTRSFLDVVDAVGTAGSASDLEVVYLPVTDDVGHELLGLLDGPRAAAGWRHVAAGYRLADELVARTVARRGPQDTVLVTSDHGMAAVTTTFFPNNVLVAAGLAQPSADGREGADHRRSAALFHVAENGLLTAGGAAAAGPDAVRRAVEALRAVRDPSSGRAAVEAVWDVHGRPVDPAGDAVSHHLAFAPGVMARADVTPHGAPFGPPDRSAGHTTATGDPRLRATFAAAGPGTARWSPTRNSQVAGLVLDALGLVPPPSSALRLAVTGPSGSGKSTFVGLLEAECTRRGLRLQRLHLAAPLYRLQREVRAAAGTAVADDAQDQLLMESLATHLRRLNPRSLVDPVLQQVASSAADVVVVDDLRDAEVDAPALLADGFTVLRVRTQEADRLRRRAARGDTSTSDASTANLSSIPVDHLVENLGTVDDLAHRAAELLEELLDPDRS